MSTKTLDDFMDKYRGTRQVIEVDAVRNEEGESPFLVVRHGKFIAVVNPMTFTDHLCVDVHSFVDGQDATAGVFGMSEGQRFVMGEGPMPKTTSHGWASTHLVAVLIGEQGTKE